jgi:DNA-directed RNA polymerase specialized sigma24 family protein
MDTSHAPPGVSVGRLFDEFADGVYTLAYRILGDRHLAEDVVQETFIKVMKALDTYRGDVRSQPGCIASGTARRSR